MGVFQPQIWYFWKKNFFDKMKIFRQFSDIPKLGRERNCPHAISSATTPKLMAGATST